MSKISIIYMDMFANKAEKAFDNVNAAAEWLEHNGTVMLIDAKEIQ